MKLHKVHIREFKSVRDSGEFEVGKTTALVGKNEAGKTAILQAIYRLNPIIAGDAVFSVTDDYPRMEVEDYEHSVSSGKRAPTTVVAATFKLDEAELQRLNDDYGPGILPSGSFTLSRAYPKEKGAESPRTHCLQVDEGSFVKHVCESYAVPVPDHTEAIKECSTVAQLVAFLTRRGAEHEQNKAKAIAAAEPVQEEPAKTQALTEANALAESEVSKKLKARLAEIQKTGGLAAHIWTTVLQPKLPSFLYFDEYYQMTGRDSVKALKERKTSGTLKKSDLPLLGLIELARLDLDKLLAVTETQELKNKLEGASNHLSKQVLKYWSQNRHLWMAFDVRDGKPQDPEGMREGSNIWGEVVDRRHNATTGLRTR